MNKDLVALYTSGIAPGLHHGDRVEKLLGSNCTAVTLMSFRENDRVIRLIVKKSRIGADKMDLVTQEHELLKHYLGDIIPSQAFIPEVCSEGSNRQLITAICTPVAIAYDIFEGDNFNMLKRELDGNSDLQNDIDLFIAGYKQLAKQGFIIDLFGDENLVLTREGRLRYIDSFIIDMSGRKSLSPICEQRFQKLCTLQTL